MHQGITALLLLCFLCTRVKGQDNTAKIGVAVSGGVNLSSMILKYDDPAAARELDMSPKFGYSVGIPFRYNFQQKCFLSGALSFTRNNAQVSIGSIPKLQYDLTFSSISLPIEFNYIIHKASRHKIFIGAGLSPTRLVGASNRVTLTNGPTSNTNSFDALNQYQPWNLLAGFSLGADINIARTIPISLNISVNRSLIDMSREEYAASAPGFDYSNEVATVMMQAASVNLCYHFIK